MHSYHMLIFISFGGPSAHVALRASSGAPRLDDRIVELKDKGKASATVLFDVTTPFEAEPVIPTLFGISNECKRTIQGFEALLS